MLSYPTSLAQFRLMLVCLLVQFSSFRLMRKLSIAPGVDQTTGPQPNEKEGLGLVPVGL